MIAALWKVFTKAGQPGWAAIIPILNTYFVCKVAGRPGWWVILMLIPFVNFIIWIILCIDVAKSFGKGVGFGIGLLLLRIIFFPILGFGSAQYQGPSAAPGVGGFSATAARLGLETFTFLRSTQEFRFVREPAARYYRGHGSDFCFPGVKLKPD